MVYNNDVFIYSPYGSFSLKEVYEYGLGLSIPFMVVFGGNGFILKCLNKDCEGVKW